MVIWLLGISGSGKTILATKLYEYLKMYNNSWVLIDGDLVRNIFDKVGFSISEREKNSLRIQKLCQFLDTQNINAIVPILSIFPKHQGKNKTLFKEYKQIYLKASLEDVKKWDNKGVYKNNQNVVGIDIEFPKPISSDLVFENREGFDFDKAVKKILKEFQLLNDEYVYTKKNLLFEPTKYQYTKFEVNFFDKFYKNRKKAIVFFENKIKRINHKNDYIKDNTTKMLENLYSNFDLEKILNLIQRFEVSKKIYTKYDESFLKKDSNSYENMISYILLSQILSKYFNKVNKYQKAIFLNALLKVNDLIISAKELLVDSEIAFAKKAIDDEVKILKEFYAI